MRVAIAKRQFALERHILVVIGLGLACLACSGDDSDSNDSSQGVQGEAGLCADLSLLQSSLNELQDLTPSSTVAEAQEARNQVQFALSEIQEAGNEVPTNLNAMLQSSFTTFNAELDSVAGESSGGTTLGSDAATLQASATGMQQAENEIALSAKCPA